jgi:hypothetical protein
VYGTDEGDRPYLGTINSKSFLGRPPGTVLFDSVTPQKKKSPLGVGWEWSLTFHFIFKHLGWNWLYYRAPSGGSGSGWYYVGILSAGHHFADTVGDDDSLYAARDHRLLFSVAA